MVDEPDRRPALRASDADRERAVDLLREAGGDGRLDVAELDERTTSAYRARTLTELEVLTHDLVPAAAAAPRVAASASSGVTVRPGDGGDHVIVSIMSGSDRKGRWRLAAHCLVLNIMGGSDLDLNDVELADQRTTINVVSIMGGADIRLPSGVDVQVTRFAFMGGHDVKLDLEPPPAGAPVIHLKMFALMGGNNIRQGRKRSKEAKRAEKARERDQLGR